MSSNSFCRTCLSKKADKNISQLEFKQDEIKPSEIMSFCLDIQVDENSKISTKLCFKCYKRILLFYKFKLQAQKTNTLLKNEEREFVVKNEVFILQDLKNDKYISEDLKNEEVLINQSFITAEKNCVEVKEEPKEEDHLEDCESDNELLSVVKKIKYEYITEEFVDETKENEPITNKKGQRKKTSKLANTSQVCEECGKTVRNLREHANLHMKTRKRYPCKVCNKTFASPSSRYKHHRVKHLGIKKTCPICGKLVVNISSHVLLVHNTSALRYPCAVCGRRFITQSSLDVHSVVHTSERPYACDVCDKTFRTKIVMSQHKRQVHDKEKLHMCQYCSKSFFKKCHLQIHLRTHTKERPYECPDCGKFFSSRTILKNHRMLHKGEKLYNCQFCDMTFARPGYLTVHMVCHTKDKRHPCKYCGVKFGRSDHRKRHEYTAHERPLLNNPAS